jgi:hypothetical protein
VDGVLLATKPSIWSQDYAIALDGAPLTTWQTSFWGNRSGFALEGRQWSTRHNAWGSRYELSCEPGGLVGIAEGLNRKHWSITGYGRRYDFQRASIWRSDQWLMSAGQPVGSIRRPSSWRSDAVAELPGLPVPLQVFALGVMLTVWRKRAAAAAST